MLQLSILQTFYEILSNRSISNSEQHQFAVAFLTKLVRHLFQKLKKSPMLFVDILFWKSKQDCHCISADYMIHGLRKGGNGKNEFAGRPVNVMDRRELLNSLRNDDDDELDNAANEGGDADLNGNQSRFVCVVCCFVDLFASLSDDNLEDADCKYCRLMLVISFSSFFYGSSLYTKHDLQEIGKA